VGSGFSNPAYQNAAMDNVLITQPDSGEFWVAQDVGFIWSIFKMPFGF
jgi:hypothetical protein